jgi:acyl-[acyl carrier protein]--UDP-N-acetylglucosamine O-acyltransferase
LLYRSNLNVKQACEKIAADFSGPDVIARLLAFVASSKRGIIR